MWVLKRDEYQVTPDVGRAISALRGPDCDEGPAIAVGSGLIRELWRTNDAPLRRAAIVDAIVSALTSNRQSGKVIRRLKLTLATAFNIAPTFLVV